MEFKVRGNNDLYNIKALFTFNAKRNVGILRSKSIAPSLLELIRITGYEFRQSHYDPEVDSASNRNEYQVYFLGVKAAGA